MSEQSFHGPIQGDNVFAGFSAAGSATLNFNLGGVEPGRQQPPTNNSSAEVRGNHTTNGIGDLRASGQSNVHVGNSSVVQHYNTGPVNYGAPQPQRARPFSMVPFPPDPNFVDRPDITFWLRNSTTRSSNRKALVGLGGVGKSQLAIYYADEVRQNAPDTFVFWVHASSKARFEEAYRTIADRLEIPGRDNPQADVLRLVLNWLQNEENGPWLVILDNADEVDVLFKKYFTPSIQNERALAEFLPKIGRGSILITSRNRIVAEKLGASDSIYSVPTMEKDQALSLLQNKLGRCDDNYTDLVDLVETLGHIPLALSQAAAYLKMRQSRMSVRSYLDKFHESDRMKEMLLHRDAGDFRRYESASNSVITTWQVTFNQIREEKPSAADLLSLMSLFNPQGIPEFILEGYTRLKGDYLEESFDEDLEILCGYSLVSRVSNGDLDIHFLVQLCTRIWLSVSNSIPLWKREFLFLIVHEYPYPEYENWEICLKLDPHIEGILREQPTDENESVIWTNVIHNIAVFRRMMGSYSIAEQLLLRVFEIRKARLGEEHPSTLGCLGELASTFAEQGKYQAAQKLEQRILEIYQRKFGGDYPDTLTAAGNLAINLSKQGKYQEAQQLNQQVLEIRQRILGSNHPDTLNNAINLATDLSRQGKYQEAQQFNQQVFEIRQRVLGSSHPDTLTSAGNLARDLSQQGKHQEAQQLNQQILGTQQRILGRDHPSTLLTASNLAIDLSKQGKYQEAQQLNQQVLEIRQRILGSSHPDTLDSAGNLAADFYNQRQFRESLEIRRQVLESRQRVFGRDHPDVFQDAHNLASSLLSMGHFEEARGFCEAALEGCIRVFGEEDSRSQNSSTLLEVLSQHLNGTFCG